MSDDALVLRRVRAIDPSHGLDSEVDVVIERGRISRVGYDAGLGLLRESRVRVVDHSGAWLLPGLITGYVDRIDTAPLTNISAASWLAVCQSAHALWHANPNP